MPKSPESVIRKSPDKEDYLVESRENERAKIFNIWYVEPDVNTAFDHTESRKQKKHIAEWKEDQKQLYALADRRMAERINAERQDESSELPRPYMITTMGPRELYGHINLSYELQSPEEFGPEIIVVRYMTEREDIYDSGNSIDTQLIGRIRERINLALKEMRLEDKSNLLQPIIVVVSQNKTNNEFWVEQGANCVLPDFDIEDINQLAQLTAKIKSDPASLAPERVMAEKREFYKKVSGLKMEDRSEITADTEQELQILKNLLPKESLAYVEPGYDEARNLSHGLHQKMIGVKWPGDMINVLDIGCGSGRITNQLAKNSQLHMTGLDGNQKLLAKAKTGAKRNDLYHYDYIEGNLIDYGRHEAVKHSSQDAVIYTWHSFLEAFGPGNTMRTLGSAWLALKEGGFLIFDQPTRDNPDMSDGWYYNQVNEDTEYLSYIMTEDEIKFMLRITGFEDVEFVHWQTKPSEIYPEGMKKITVRAKKRRN